MDNKHYSNKTNHPPDDEEIHYPTGGLTLLQLMGLLALLGIVLTIMVYCFF